jgi:hypothetical protein
MLSRITIRVLTEFFDAHINTKTRAEKRRTERLQSFGLDERALQDILFRSLDRLFPEDELILLMQSRNWQEEPDLMAVDKAGHLFIFELKAWESHSANLLQVLRYGQLYGAMKYPELDAWFKKATDPSQSLKVAHRAKFGVELSEESFNRKQVFVVMTNGLDYRTRVAAQYWRTSGLDVRPWVYRVYAGDTDEMLLEMAPFRVLENPYEDIAEGYYPPPTPATPSKTTTICWRKARQQRISTRGNSRSSGCTRAMWFFCTNLALASWPLARPTENSSKPLTRAIRNTRTRNTP